jgi:hypothetical protein
MSTPAILQLSYAESHSGLQDLLELSRSANAQLATYQRLSPAADFYMKRKLPLLISVNDVDQYRKSAQKPHYILCTEDTVGRFKLLAKPKTLVTFRRKLYLFSLE